MTSIFRYSGLAGLLAMAACTTPEEAPHQSVVSPEVTVEITAMPAAVSADTVSTSTTTFSGDWPQPYVSAASGPFDDEEIAALEARMAQFVEDGTVKGIASLLVHDGKVVSHMQTGVRRESDGAPIEEDTIYRIYSMTKPVTGVAMMILYDEGAYSLDDPVTKFIPELENLQVWNADGEPQPVSRPPTMRELMSHTAGFAYGLSDITPPDAQLQAQAALFQPDMQSFVDIVAATPLLMEPGTNWYYSVSVDLQGVIVERITGQSFGAFLQERIFDPLGMDDTGFVVPADQYDRFGDVFVPDAETGALVPFAETWVTFTEDTVGFQSGGGGLVSTLDDYARFCQMLLDGGSLGDTQILKPETVALMSTNVLTEGQTIFGDGGQGEVPTGVGFGLNVGVIIGPDATDRYGRGTHFWGGAAGTWYWIDPQNDLFFIGMIQRFSPSGANTDFREVSGQLISDALHDED